MNSITIPLVWCVLQVTLFSLSAVVIYLVVRRWSSGAASAALTGSLAIVLVLTALAASPWPRWQLAAQPAAATRLPRMSTAPAAESAAVSGSPSEANGIAKHAQAPARSPLVASWTAFAEAMTKPQGFVSEASGPARKAWSIVGLLAAIGVAVSAWRLGRGLVYVRRLRQESQLVDNAPTQEKFRRLCDKLAIPHQVALYESRSIATPATIGWRRPAVILPYRWREWLPEEVEAAIAHELAHVAGRDFLNWTVARLAVVCHFYHPLIRWLAARLQLEQELTADSVAVALVGDRKNYLHALASLALATPQHRTPGAVRTLIPSRSLLIRRVEMLRNTKAAMARRTSQMSWLACGCLLAIAAIIAGIRQPVAGRAVAAAPEASAVETSSGEATRIPLQLAPLQTVYALAVQPARLFANEQLRPIASGLDEWLQPLHQFGVSVQDFDEVLVCGYGNEGEQVRLVIRLTTPEICDRLIAKIVELGQLRAIAETAPQNKVWRSDRQQLTQIDPNTLVLDRGGRKRAPFAPLDSQRAGAQDEWRAQWAELSDRLLVGAVDLNLVRGLVPPSKQTELFGQLPAQMIAPLLEQTEWSIFSASLENESMLEVVTKCHSADAAQGVAGTMQALLTLASNAIRQQQSAIKAAPEGGRTINSGVAQLLELAGAICTEAKVETDEAHVRLVMGSDVSGAKRIAAALQLFVPAVQAARTAAMRTQDVNNLRQLALAMLNYESVHGHFPPAIGYEYEARGEQGAVARKSEFPHSWRVALLPFSGHADLYEQYRFDQPWDSEANQAVLAKMPVVFRSPFDDSSSTNTSYFVLTGPDGVFPEDQTTSVRQIRDGMSRTILLVEAKRNVPWTKPQDIPYASGQPVPKLGGWMPKVFQVALCDGSALPVSQQIDDEQLRNLIGKSDGRPVRLP